MIKKTIETDNIPDIDGKRLPRLCPQLLGQDKICRLFYDNFCNQQLHHAWLLSGQKGIGKASFAYQFARFLLHWQTPEKAQQALTDAAELKDATESPAHQLYVPPDSSTTQLVNARAHPDLLVITRAWDSKNGSFKERISVDSTRQIHSFLSRTAGMGGWRICIIDSADDLSPSAANALLKIVEEPPDKALFLIISHQPTGLLPTLRSRCQHAPMPPLSTESVTTLLTRYLKDDMKKSDIEKGDIENADLPTDLSAENIETIAYLAGGSIGRALAIAEADGLQIYRKMTELLAKMPHVHRDALYQFADQVNQRKRGQGDSLYALYTGLLSDWLHRLVRLGAGVSPFAVNGVNGATDTNGTNDMNDSETDKFSALFERESKIMHQLIAAASLPQWVEVWEKTAHYHRQVIQLNLDRRQTILECFALIKTAAKP
ncbi:MAG: DNA polymerase III subunit delta' [Alphaproteobacteria bacterium]|nr:DNA polymerase III subunit delta' [Alphaproteobacteria bacterium]